MYLCIVVFCTLLTEHLFYSLQEGPFLTHATDRLPACGALHLNMILDMVLLTPRWRLVADDPLVGLTQFQT